MPFTAGEVFTEVQGFLNDVGKSTYTDAKLGPFLRVAYRELRDRLNSFGMSPDIHIESKTIAAAGTDYGKLPDDFMAPYYMEERRPGGADSEWVRMQEVGNIPVRTRDSCLVHWAYRGSTILFVGSSTNTEVRLHYWGDLLPTLSNPVNAVDEMTQLALQNYLVFRTTAFAARSIGEDVDRASDFQAQAQSEMDLLLATYAKNEQSVAYSRPPRPRRFW